jgi:hypothetical protein
MTPAGYMAKHVYKKSDWIKVCKNRMFLECATQVIDVYSASNCLSKNFADYVPYWKHNGYWLFDSPEVIKSISKENSIGLEGTSLFYYEAHEMEFDEGHWRIWSPEPSFPANVAAAARKRLEGFDVVTFYARSTPECSPLSCNSMAEEVRTNAHCLFESFDEAETSLNNGLFKDAEPGPCRIFSVYSVDWS